MFLDLRAPGEIRTSTNFLDFDVFDLVDAVILGDDVASIVRSLSVTSEFSAPAGSFTDAFGGSANSHLFTFNGASMMGTFTGQLTISSTDPFLRARTVDFTVQTVPEPMSLIALGLGAIGILRRRSRRSVS